jgi:hypothetical protein
MLLTVFQVLFAIVDEGGDALVQFGFGAGIVNLEKNELDKSLAGACAGVRVQVMRSEDMGWDRRRRWPLWPDQANTAQASGHSSIRIKKQGGKKGKREPYSFINIRTSLLANALAEFLCARTAGQLLARLVGINCV